VFASPALLDPHRSVQVAMTSGGERVCGVGDAAAAAAAHGGGGDDNHDCYTLMILITRSFQDVVLSHVDDDAFWRGIEMV
jgi:hypothetical protein